MTIKRPWLEKGRILAWREGLATFDELFELVRSKSPSVPLVSYTWMWQTVSPFQKGGYRGISPTGGSSVRPEALEGRTTDSPPPINYAALLVPSHFVVSE